MPTYRWYKELANDTLFEYDKKQIKLHEDENEALLSLVANSATFGQRFKCEATNDQGTAEKYFTLMKMEKPSKISEVKHTFIEYLLHLSTLTSPPVLTEYQFICNLLR